jgi:hypothetical protein
MAHPRFLNLGRLGLIAIRPQSPLGIAHCLLHNERTVHKVVPEHDADRYLDVERARRLADAGNDLVGALARVPFAAFAEPSHAAMSDSRQAASRSAGRR